MATQYHPASVDSNQLQELKGLESKLGTVLVAMKPEPTDYARLTAEQLAEIKVMEQRLGMVIVAFDN